MISPSPRVRVGVGICTAEVPPGSERSMADEYADVLFLAQRAEELGLSSIWTSEHHGVSDGYLPSQLVLLAGIAAVTERLALGTAVVLAPLHDPVRLAEDAAVVDHLSRGRLSLGLGIGWRDEEFRMFGIPTRERVPRLVQTVEILRRAWGGERFSTSGPFGDRQDIRVTPRPHRAGGPPVLLGGSHPSALRRAGLLGDGFVRSRASDTALVREDTAAVLAAVRESGRTERDFEMVLLQNVFLLGTAGPGRDRTIFETAAYQLGAYAAWHDDDDTPGHGFTSRRLPPEVVHRSPIAGGPDEVRAGLARLVRAVGSDCRVHLVVRLWYPGMRREDAVGILDSFGRAVLPSLLDDVS